MMNALKKGLRPTSPQPNRHTLGAGFTMVELLVAMSLFSVIISIVTGVFIQSLRSQKAAIALITINSNAGLAMEQMAREMRTGQSFLGGGDEINFVNSKGKAVTYRLDAKRIVRREDSSNFKAITANDINVKNLDFTLYQGTPGDPYPPRITIVMKIGAVGRSVEGIDIDLQTTVSSRALK